MAPPPIQRPAPPIMIAGGGERITPELVAGKFSSLREHCGLIGRDYDSVLRTYATGWTILAPDEASLAAKMARYFPQGIEQRYSGTWRHFVFSATPDDAIIHFRALRVAGVQYFIVQTLDATDTETIMLLAKEVVPRI